jgi:hypothetical protein
MANRLTLYDYQTTVVVRKEADDHVSYVTKSTGISGIMNIESHQTFRLTRARPQNSLYVVLGLRYPAARYLSKCKDSLRILTYDVTNSHLVLTKQSLDARSLVSFSLNKLLNFATHHD